MFAKRFRRSRTVVPLCIQRARKSIQSVIVGADFVNEALEGSCIYYHCRCDNDIRFRCQTPDIIDKVIGYENVDGTHTFP